MITAIIIADLFVPYLFLYWFYGPHFSDIYGDYFVKIYYFMKMGYVRYIYASKYIHTSAMLGLYFYLSNAFFLTFLSFLAVKKYIFKSDSNDDEKPLRKENKASKSNKIKNDLSLDILDNIKR